MGKEPVEVAGKSIWEISVKTILRGPAPCTTLIHAPIPKLGITETSDFEIGRSLSFPSTIWE